MLHNPLAIPYNINIMEEKKFKQWQCTICAFIYNEEEGWPEDGIAPGTRWEDIPENWVCPDCGAKKSDFNMVEIDID